MKMIDPMYADERSARLRMHEADGDAAGPQGEALILELQRLRQAFEQENRPEPDRPQPRRAPPDGQRSQGRRPPRPQARPKRSKKKGKMGRVLDAWLGPFGFQGDVHDGDAPAARGSQAVREPELMSPQRTRGPIIAPDDPSLINIPRPSDKTFDRRLQQPRPAPGPASKPASRPAERHAARPVLEIEPTLEMRDPLRIEAPRLAPSIPAGAVVSGRSQGRMVDIARQGVSKSVAFLVNRDGSPDVAGAPGESIVQRAGRAYEHELRTGMRALLVVGGLAFGLMVLLPLSGAVVVPGNLVVQSNVKTIQHPTGGVVSQIPVRNGMRVTTGDLLLRLDSTQAQANQQVVSKQLDEVRAKISRLVCRARRSAPAGDTRRKCRRGWTTAMSRTCWRQRLRCSGRG